MKPAAEKQILDFILERARFVLRERLGFAYDEVNATFAAGADDLVDAVHRLEALKAIRKSKNFEPLAVSFKRIRKIIEKAGAAEGWRLPGVQPELRSTRPSAICTSRRARRPRAWQPTSGPGNIEKRCKQLQRCAQQSTNSSTKSWSCRKMTQFAATG